MSRHSDHDDNLAYGEFHGDAQSTDGERGFIGDVGRRFFGGGKKPQQGDTSVTQQYQPHLAYGEQPGPEKPSGGMSSLFDKAHGLVHGLGSEVKERLSNNQQRPTSGAPANPSTDSTTGNRFNSFAPERTGGNDIKWYVDGCGYMWAVSVALERARESIWILDWWLSPELYLRRPPAKNQQYRVDRMLKAAAERGVKVNIIVYKEVTQALTRKLLNPTLPDYLHSLLPKTTDRITKFISRVGLDVIFNSLEQWEKDNPLIAPPLTVSSSHTKHALEDLHPNIAVFRHPDHLPDQKVLTSSFLSSLQNLSLSAASIAKLPGQTIEGIYGVHEGTVLYWAHHEKLCLIDGRTAFMGGLDLCYGRWDTNQHPISDAHPGDLDNIVFPGQDYNNARIMDFQDVVNWENNKLDRTKSSRMGWSDVSLCLTGPAVEDLKSHFSQRWNFLFKEKYSHKDPRYALLPERATTVSATPQGQQRDVEGEERGFGGEGERGIFGLAQSHGQDQGGLRGQLQDRLNQGFQHVEHRIGSHYGVSRPTSSQGPGGTSCQITRSCAKWSHGGGLEHSIQNAYCEVIRNSEHFVYIENQFFITATGDKQRPIKNKIGEAMVERILRAARKGEKYKMIIVIPAVPAFAGDLKSDDALSTRAIMEFQYDSINRGGNSIYERIAQQGFNPMEYIRFYNLRSYDRINVSGVMAQAEKQSGVRYEDARKEHDAAFGGVYASDNQTTYQAYRPGMPANGSDHTGPAQYSQESNYKSYQSQAPASIPGNVHEMDGNCSRGLGGDAYQQYQQGAQGISDRKGLAGGRWDSVSECYMLGGEDIRNVPWEHGAMDEIDAFVSEELYVHSKVCLYQLCRRFGQLTCKKLLIADDRIVICGSANLNDRSQLGDHDSEIAIVVNDPTPVEGLMDGRPWRGSRFASSLRRQIFRKHLGLLKPQVMDHPDQNYEPIGVPNIYDWGSYEDILVTDPLSDEFLNFWNQRARANTDAFGRVFHPVPSDSVRNWKQYDEYYERFFHEQDGDNKEKKPSKYKWGHVVAEEFPPGEQGVKEVKEILSTIKGTLVEMPLLFLKEEDIAKEGLGLNAFTEEVYT
ncbi:phospholipase D/nuclease [Pseudovirgaria hyperparasitica]|uniref:Phospholipase n=1 Tax=Pseudovirgaria hyperparasitica TaxID=470096 RepID=A0A6A6W888_9PEZI|nr:phospholipase D/nuclease [Pseudovirgaria hyperparasitica]KAF2758863.1 phospholipase D/nuclease [Pseudovirgaria hyperparasitica]